MPSTDLHIELRWTPNKGEPDRTVCAPAGAGVFLRAGDQYEHAATSTPTHNCTTARVSIDVSKTKFTELELGITLPGEVPIGAGVTGSSSVPSRGVYVAGRAFLDLMELKKRGEVTGNVTLSRYLATSARPGPLGQPQSSLTCALVATARDKVHIPPNLATTGISVVKSIGFLNAKTQRVLAGLVGDGGVLDQLDQPNNTARSPAGTNKQAEQQIKTMLRGLQASHMLLPDGQLVDMTLPIDAAFLHGLTEANAEVAIAHSKDIRCNALETWVGAWRRAKEQPNATPAQHVGRQLRLLARKCNYAFDPEWDCGADGRVVVGSKHGENFSIHGTPARCAVLDEQIESSLSRAISNMAAATTLEQLQSAQVLWSDAIHAILSGKMDCEDIAGLIHLTGAVMAADVKDSREAFVHNYSYYSPIVAMPPSEFKKALGEVYSFAVSAWPRNASVVTSLVLAGGAKVDAEQGQAAATPAAPAPQSVQPSVAPRDALLRVQREVAQGLLAGHAVATLHQPHERPSIGTLRVPVDADVITYTLRKAPQSWNFFEGTAETVLLPADAHTNAPTNMSTQAVAGGAYETGIPVEIAKIGGPGTVLDATNKIAALSAKQICSNCHVHGLQASSDVGYTARNNFYKVMLSAGPELVFHINDAHATAARVHNKRVPPINSSATLFEDVVPPKRSAARNQMPTNAPVDETVVFIVEDNGNGDAEALGAAAMAQLAQQQMLQQAIARTELCAGARCDDILDGRMQAITVQRDLTQEEHQHMRTLAQFWQTCTQRSLTLDKKENLQKRRQLGHVYRSLYAPLSQTNSTGSTDTFTNSITFSGLFTPLPHRLAAALCRVPDFKAAEAAFQTEQESCNLYAEHFLHDHTNSTSLSNSTVSIAGMSHCSVPADITQLALSQKVFTEK